MIGPSSSDKGKQTMLETARGFFRFSRAFRNAYGLFGGLFVAVQLRKSYRLPLGTVYRTRVPGLQHHVFLRAGTADTDVFRQIFLNKELDLYLDPPPAFVLDAGAHIGLASVFLCHRFPTARVLALEIERGNFELLKRNVAEYPNVIPVQKGLWGARGRLSIDNPGDETWAFRAREAAVGVPGVEAVGVVDILEEFGLEELDLLKVDIEGGEKELFSSNVEPWIDRVRVIVVELHDRFRPGCREAVLSALVGRSWQQMELGEHLVLWRRGDVICRR